MSKPSGEPSFEGALAELEKIVTRMEGGELSLEEALAVHRRGLELARFCQQKLEAAQQQVKVLEGEIKEREKVRIDAVGGELTFETAGEPVAH